MVRFLRPALAGIAGASVLAAAGCASRPGVQPIPETLEAYNGEWVLETADRAPGRLQFMSRDGSGFSSKTGQRILAMLGIRAERFVLQVSDSVFRVSSDEPGSSFSLPMDGTPLEVRAEDGEVQTMTLTWRDGTPVVRRTLPGTGWVSDRFELTADGALVIVRTAAMRNTRGIDVEGTQAVQLAYIRSTGTGTP